MASEKYDAVPTVETSSHPQCSNWLRRWLQNQNASRSEKALDRGRTLRSNQPRTWNEVSNRHHICDRHSDLSDSRGALHLTVSRDRTLHNCNTVNTPVCLWQRLFKTTCKTGNMKWNVNFCLSLCGPLSNANSTLLRSMLDCNQNVSCQLSVVERCFSIVDLIKFGMSLACTCWKFGVEICWKRNRIGNKLQCLPNWNTILVLTSSLAQPHQSLMPHVKTLQKIHCLRSGPNGISFWKLKRTWVCMFEVTTNCIDDLIPQCSFSVTESWLKLRSGLPLPQGVNAWICTQGGHEEFLHCRMQTATRLNFPELCTLATTPMYGTFETSQTFLKFECSEQHSSTIATEEPWVNTCCTHTAHEVLLTQLSSHLEQQSQEHTGV